jgi:hypothetical protein
LRGARSGGGRRSIALGPRAVRERHLWNAKKRIPEVFRRPASCPRRECSKTLLTTAVDTEVRGSMQTAAQVSETEVLGPQDGASWMIYDERLVGCLC